MSKNGRKKKPQLSDLRESGEIEQTADLVLFIHREDYYQNSESNRLPSHYSPTELVIAKQRNGPTGSVNFMFRKDISVFYPADTVHAGT